MQDKKRGAGSYLESDDDRGCSFVSTYLPAKFDCWISIEIDFDLALNQPFRMSRFSQLILFKSIHLLVPEPRYNLQNSSTCTA